LFPYPTDLQKFSAPQHAGVRQATRDRLNIPRDAHVLLCVAKFVERENPMDAIRTYLAARRRINNMYLIAVGSGNRALASIVDGLRQQTYRARIWRGLTQSDAVAP